MMVFNKGDIVKISEKCPLEVRGKKGVIVDIACRNIEDFCVVKVTNSPREDGLYLVFKRYLYLVQKHAWSVS